MNHDPSPSRSPVGLSNPPSRASDCLALTLAHRSCGGDFAPPQGPEFTEYDLTAETSEAEYHDTNSAATLAISVAGLLLPR
jgi:hypothetical protein